MRLHRPSLTAFARDVAHAAGVLTVVAAIADYATENRRLRERNRALEFEVSRLSQVLLGAAGTSRDDLMDLADAVAVDVTADLDELASVDTFQDFLWLTGGDQ